MRDTVFVVTMLILMMFVYRTGLAQSTQQQSTQQQSTQRQSAQPQSTDRSQDAVDQEPDKGNAFVSSESSTSIVDSIFRSTRNRLGFSVSVDESYIPSYRTATSQSPSATFTSVYPSVFTNFAGRSWTSTLNYSFGYSKYGAGDRSVYGTHHLASASLSRTLSRNATFSFGDSFSSGLNDYGYSPASYLAVQRIVAVNQLAYSPEILVTRQRITANSAVAGLSYKAGRKGNISLYASHVISRYGISTRTARAVNATISGDYQVTRWMYLSSAYSGTLNRGEDQFHKADVHRLQLAGFRFKLGRRIEAFTSGGLEYAHSPGLKRAIGTAEAGISRTVGSNTLYLLYHYGFTTAFGPGVLLKGHNVLASFAHNQRISRNAYFVGSLSYTRGEYGLHSSLEMATANVGLQFQLARNLVATTNVAYARQLVRNLSFQAPHVSRPTVWAGLNYFLPALRGRLR
jgi:hypothetical protein